MNGRHLNCTIIFAWLGLFSGCSDSSPNEDYAKDIHIPFPTPSLPNIDLKIIDQCAQRDGMVRIPSGQFSMGSPPSEIGRNADETLHKVQISHPFWIKKHEVTQEEWNQFAPENEKRGLPVFTLSGVHLSEICSGTGYVEGTYSVALYESGKEERVVLEEAVLNKGHWIREKSPRNYKVDSGKFENLEEVMNYFATKQIPMVDYMEKLLPVTQVSYSQATAFCWEKTSRARRDLTLPSPFIFRLPTEAEWEFACRAEHPGPSGLGEGNFLTGENANINGSRKEYIWDNRARSEFSVGAFTPINRKKLTPITPQKPQYPANPWGIHDMHGNVMEWCYDFYGPYPDDNQTYVDPIGPIRGTQKIVRGGSFLRTAYECRSAKRAKYEPSYRGSEIGFRYVIGLPLR